MGWRLFDWQRITSVPYQDEVLGPLALAYLIVFGVGLLVSAVLYFRPPARLREHGLRRRVSQRITVTFIWVCAIGLAFFLFRVMGLPFLGIRLWLWIMTAAFVVTVGYFVYYRLARYPAEAAAYEAELTKRRYQQAARRRATANGAPLPRSPRSEKRARRTVGRQR